MTEKPWIAWMLGVLLFIAGYTAASVGEQSWAGIMFVMAGALLVPPLWQWVSKRFTHQPSEKVRWGVAFTLAITASLMMSAKEEAEASRMVEVTSKSKNRLLCVTPESFEEIISTTDATNERLEREYRNRPDAFARLVTSEIYFVRMHAATEAKLDAMIAQGKCVRLGMQSTFMAVRKHLAVNTDPMNTDIIPVTYQGRAYWTHAGSLALVTPDQASPR